MTAPWWPRIVELADRLGVKTRTGSRADSVLSLSDSEDSGEWYDAVDLLIAFLDRLEASVVGGACSCVECREASK